MKLKHPSLKHSLFSRPRLGLFILVFAAIGGYILVRSLAAPNPNLPGDLNNDNTVNVTDLSILLSNYGTTNTNADINNDGAVNVLDMSILLSNYGRTYTPPAASCPAPATGSWSGCYYNGTSFNTLAMVRNDSSINFDWPSGTSPGIGVNTTAYSTRWQGNFSFNASSYSFTMTVDDGARLYIDNNLVMDHWVDEYATTYTATQNITAGNHAIKLEYYNNAGTGTAKLSWSQGSTNPPPSAGTVLWNGNYETGDWTQWDEGGSHLQCDLPGGHAAIQTSALRQGRYAASYSTPPYDGTNRSRCQTYLNGHTYYGNEGQENWFGFSYMIPSGSQLSGGGWNNIETWHHGYIPNQLPAPLHYAITNNGRVWTMRIDAWGGPWTSFYNGVKYGDQSHADGWNQYRQTWDVGAVTTNKWYDIVLHIKWSADPTIGFLETWINGQKVLTRTPAATLYSGDSVYLKEGYDGGGVNSTTTVYHDAAVIAGDYLGAISNFPAGTWPSTAP